MSVEDLPPYYPDLVHSRCRVKVQRRCKQSKKDKKNKKPEEGRWTLPDFPNPRRKSCSYCKIVPEVPHNSLTCPVRLSKEERVHRPRKPLMDLVDRTQAKERIQPLIDHFENYCEVKHERKKDVLAFEYRRELFKEGKYRAAKTFESFHRNPSQILIKPLSPRKTASRTVMSGMSWNKSRSDFAYMTQKGVPVLAPPGETDMFRWSQSPLNISFSLRSLCGQYTSEYTAPSKPVKPTQDDWSSKEEKNEMKRTYRKEYSSWENSLRPAPGSQTLGVPRIPETVNPSVISSSYPYQNVLAYSIVDARDIIKKNLVKNKVPHGTVKVATHASDGCNGFGSWHLSSECSKGDLPDHGLSYDVKIMKIKTVEAPFATLFEDTGASVTACKPIMCAAANENDHMATHLLTIPIERQRSGVEKVEMTVKLDEDYTIISTSESDPTKVDLKYNLEQSNLGERNYGCHLCTSPRASWFKKEAILAGYPLNRNLAESVIEAERRRINPDAESQLSLKEKSKGVTHTPIYQAEHVRHLVEPLHNSLSFGRALVDLLVRFNSDIFSATIEASVKPVYESSKNEIKNMMLEKFGFSPFMGLTGVQVSVLFKNQNHEKLLSLVPEVHQEVMEHWINETRFYLGFIFHLNPHDTFNLDEVETRFECLLLFIAEKMAWWSPPDYFHIGPAHVIQLLKLKDNDGLIKYHNLMQTGAQDKENKNKKQRMFFKYLSRKDSNQNAITDVLIRDMEESSLVMKEHGETKPVHKCGDCGGLGHHKRSQKCQKVTGRGKLIDMAKTDPKFLLRISDSESDTSLESDSSLNSLDSTADDAMVDVENADDMELEEAFEQQLEVD